jgi:hypothetical protein
MITFVIGQTLAFDKELERTRLDGHGILDINLYIEQNVYYLHARMDLKPAVIGLVTLKLYVNKLEIDITNPMSKVLAKNLADLKKKDKEMQELKDEMEKMKKLASNNAFAFEFNAERYKQMCFIDSAVYWHLRRDGQTKKSSGCIVVCFAWRHWRSFVDTP